MLWRERTLWIALTVTLGLALAAAALWGWPWEAARHSAEWERGRALLFDQHTTYDSPIIPETPEEAARRAKGMDDVEFEDLYYSSLYMPNHKLLDLNYSRVANYMAARELLNENSKLLANFQHNEIDRRRLGFTYLAQSVRDGYPPARALYDQEAEKELARALKFFEDGDDQQGWITLGALAMEDYPPAVDEMSYRFPVSEGSCGYVGWSHAAAINNSTGDMYSIRNELLQAWKQPATPQSKLAYAWNHMSAKSNPNSKMFIPAEEFNLSDEDRKAIDAYVKDAAPQDLPIPLFRFLPPAPIYLNPTDAARLQQAASSCHINDRSKDPMFTRIDKIHREFQKQNQK